MGLGSELQKAKKKVSSAVRSGVGRVDVASILGTAQQVGDVLAPEIHLPSEPEKKVMPIPDEELSKRARRRLRAKRKGGRSSSILSDSESLG